ncbi:type II toxin-antitoxin system VapC family toxin [soil metagenome]
MLDASVAVGWAFEDESGTYADAVLEALSDGGAVVPGLWGYEVVNALTEGERRKRILAADTERFLSLLKALPIEFEDSQPGGLTGLARLAREQELSAYDAAYLAVAIRRGLPLATQDRALKEAAYRSGVAVFGA